MRRVGSSMPVFVPCRPRESLGRYGFVEQQVLLELEGDALVNGHVFCSKFLLLCRHFHCTLLCSLQQLPNQWSEILCGAGRSAGVDCDVLTLSLGGSSKTGALAPKRTYLASKRLGTPFWRAPMTGRKLTRLVTVLFFSRGRCLH